MAIMIMHSLIWLLSNVVLFLVKKKTSCFLEKPYVNNYTLYKTLLYQWAYFC